MDQKVDDDKTNRKNITRHVDLRDLLERFEEIGELEIVEGADWNLELAALGELVCARNPGRAPALLFKNIKDYPESAESHFELAGIYSRQENYEKAIEEYERTLELDPLHEAARKAISRIRR